MKWELVGIAFITLLGALLHFTFELSGGLAPVGVFSAVNESVWEHFKLGFWPAVLYGIIESGFIRKQTSNFLIAKATGIYLIPITIGVIFYSYTAIIGEEFLIIDVLSFVIAVAVGQLVSYKILTSRKFPAWLNGFGLGMVILLAIAYGIFTFYPPQLPLFQGHLSGGYGIIE